MVTYENRKEIFDTLNNLIQYYDEHYNIKLSRESIRRHIKNNSFYKDRKFSKISNVEFNKYKNGSLADLVVGEAFLIA